MRPLRACSPSGSGSSLDPGEVPKRRADGAVDIDERLPRPVSQRDKTYAAECLKKMSWPTVGYRLD